MHGWNHKLYHNHRLFFCQHLGLSEQNFRGMTVRLVESHSDVSRSERNVEFTPCWNRRTLHCYSYFFFLKKGSSDLGENSQTWVVLRWLNIDLNITCIIQLRKLLIKEGKHYFTSFIFVVVLSYQPFHQLPEHYFHIIAFSTIETYLCNSFPWQLAM